MDLEVILHGGRLKLLEIDARLPSQSPIAVYWSTGYNMVEALGGLFRDPRGGGPPPLPPARRAALLEHVRSAGGRLEVCGEHVLVRRGGLRVEPGFFGAEEAITDYSPRRSDWAATLLVTGVDEAQAWRRRGEVLRAICGACGLGEILDPEPPR
jgi:pyrrolysine biosynthesis protein PylC